MAPEPRPPFATYLLPSFTFPFRRRQQSTSSTHSDHSDFAPSLSSSAGSTPSSSPPTPHFVLPSQTLSKGIKSLLHAALQNERKPQHTLQKERLTLAQPNTLKCVTCASDIAFASQIVSKGFTGRHGRAYLVAPPPKTTSSAKSNEKQVAELVNTKIGRNVNRELLTGAHVVADVSCNICATVLGWKYVDAKEAGQRYKIGKYILETKRVVVGVSWEDGLEDGDLGGEGMEHEGEGEDVVVFDSEDEDECEDLFAGTWDAEVVAKRRARRVNTRR